MLHNTTPPVVFFPDDICGPRASFESWVNTVEVNHLTARDDGSFHFVDFETGYIHVDYVDAAIPDVTGTIRSRARLDDDAEESRQVGGAALAARVTGPPTRATMYCNTPSSGTRRFGAFSHHAGSPS